ncbi:MAG: hypothetical protein JNM34_12620 [Chthonomonadaceae bacterium]|nr:hypothetical protein [Chthonomonadaceae bacterium]
MKRTILAAFGVGLAAFSSAFVVNMRVFNFEYGETVGVPSDPVIEVGDTIHWVWNANFHSVTSSTGQSESFASGLINTGSTFDHTFTNIGDFGYYCDLHGSDLGNGQVIGMAGRVFVLAPKLAESFTIFRGLLQQGGISELASSDDQYMVVQKGFVLNLTEAPIQVIMESAPVPPVPTQLVVRWEDGVNASGLTRRVEVLNTVTSQFEQIDQSAAQLADGKFSTKTSGDLSRFVDPVTQKVKVKFSYFNVGPVSNSAYQARFDRFALLVK